MPPEYTDDSESWLQVSPDELDGMLSQGTTDAKQVSHTSGQDEEQEANRQAETMSNLAKKVSSFVEAKGDMTGARFEE